MAGRWFEVYYKGNETPVRVRVGPKADVLFERHFQMSMSKAGEDISAERLYYLTWAALYAAGKEGRDFESFLDVLEDVEPVEDELVNPTLPAHEPE